LTNFGRALWNRRDAARSARASSSTRRCSTPARFVFGHAGTLDGDLRALLSKFSEPIEIVAAEPDPPPPRR